MPSAMLPSPPLPIAIPNSTTHRNKSKSITSIIRENSATAGLPRCLRSPIQPKKMQGKSPAAQQQLQHTSIMCIYHIRLVTCTHPPVASTQSAAARHRGRRTPRGCLEQVFLPFRSWAWCARSHQGSHGHLHGIPVAVGYVQLSDPYIAPVRLPWRLRSFYRASASVVLQAATTKWKSGQQPHLIILREGLCTKDAYFEGLL